MTAEARQPAPTSGLDLLLVAVPDRLRRGGAAAAARAGTSRRSRPARCSPAACCASPLLALVVPLAAMALSDVVLRLRRLAHRARGLCRDRAAGAGRHPGAALARRAAGPAVMIACSLIFFAATNFAVWAFSGMYSLDLAGLISATSRRCRSSTIHGRRRPVLGGGAVRRRLAGAAAAPALRDARA